MKKHNELIDMFQEGLRTLFDADVLHIRLDSLLLISPRGPSISRYIFRLASWRCDFCLYFFIE